MIKIAQKYSLDEFINNLHVLEWSKLKFLFCLLDDGLQLWLVMKVVINKAKHLHEERG